MNNKSTLSSIENLRNLVMPYQTQKYNTENNVSSMKMKTYYKYIAVFVTTFVLLFFIQPQFIKSVRMKEGNEIYKLDIDKLVFSTILISLVISISIFLIYRHKSIIR